MMVDKEALSIRGEGLAISDVARVARHDARVSVTNDPEVIGRIRASCELIRQAVRTGRVIYGVTTGVGANATCAVPEEEVLDLQNNLLGILKAGAGGRLPIPDVRAGMLLRLNSLVRGVSGVRLELLERIERFLNEGVTPLMHEFGSIGASGDLVPLAYLAGSITGAHDGFRVDFRGKEIGAPTALERLGLPTLSLRAKEGLALINGTSVMTGISALCVHDARALLALALATHSLALQALSGSEQSFHPFVQQHKPHPGQIQAADGMRRLLSGTRMTVEGMQGHFEHPGHELVQDRYSLRCLSQYLAPIYEGLDWIARQVEVEINSANDNPLIDVADDLVLNCGNFLGQSVAVGMDHLRYYLGLLAKHLDIQIAMLMSPEFSNGLPMSLNGNPTKKANMGLKGLQLLGNSIMPLLLFHGTPLTDRFPTHAEQYNENINSQGFGGANLARRSVETFRQYMAVALIMGVQAVDLRTRILAGHYDARECLSTESVRLYEAVRAVVGQPPSRERPYIRDDRGQEMDRHVAAIAADITAGGPIVEAVADLVA